MSGASADVLELLLRHGAEPKGIDLSRYSAIATTTAATASGTDSSSSSSAAAAAVRQRAEMRASDDQHPLLCAAIEVWTLESQLRQVGWSVGRVVRHALC